MALPEEDPEGGETTTTGQQRRRRRLWVAAVCTSISAAAILLLVVSPAAAAAAEQSFFSRKHIEALESRESGADPKWEIGSSGNWIFDPRSWEMLSFPLHPNPHLRVPREEGEGDGAEVQEQWPELRLGVRTVIAAILVALGASMTSASGLGGGLIFVPILNLLLQFDSKTSTAISQFMILGTAITGVALNLVRDHPQQMNKPMVDFDIAELLLPMMLLGNGIGVFLNTTFPNWLLTLLLTAVLIYVAVHTTRTGRKRYEVETRIANAKRVGKRPSLKRAETATEKDLSDSLKGFYKAVTTRYPLKTMLILTFVWLALFAVQILRGIHGNQGVLEVQRCGVEYWLLTASQVPIAVGVTAFVIWRRSITPPTSELEPGSSDAQEPSYVIGTKKGVLFSGMALVAGLVAGMFGLGGALIINPVLLSAGVLPQVTTATSLLLMFYSSSMSAVQYWLLGRIPVGYSLIGALISAMASAVGVLGVRKIVTKFKRPSLIVFVIAITIAFSSIIMAISGGLDAWNKYRSGSYMGFSIPC